MSNSSEPVSPELAQILGGCPTCRLWAEQDEGPYHRDAQPERRDVTEDRDGLGLQLGIRLTGEDGDALQDATVEIWQCDALGHYSGFPPPDPTAQAPTADAAPRGEYLSDQTFLRGRQDTDQSGMVEFATIYPGWYPGRTLHIHLMVHAGGRVYTSQLYFPDPISDQVLATQPYAERPGRDTTNDTDEIFPTGGAPAVLEVHTNDDRWQAGICLIVPAEPTASS